MTSETIQTFDQSDGNCDVRAVLHSCDVFLRRLTGKQMLVVHGARDSVIPISHSMQLARVRNLKLEFFVESQQVWKDRSSCEPDIGKPLYVQTRIYNIRRPLLRNANGADKLR